MVNPKTIGKRGGGEWEETRKQDKISRQIDKSIAEIKQRYEAEKLQKIEV